MSEIMNKLKSQHSKIMNWLDDTDSRVEDVSTQISMKELFFYNKPSTWKAKTAYG